MLPKRDRPSAGKISAKNKYEQSRIDYASKALSLVKEYNSQKSGPFTRAEKLEDHAQKKRRDQNVKNKAPVL